MYLRVHIKLFQSSAAVCWLLQLQGFFGWREFSSYDTKTRKRNRTSNKLSGRSFWPYKGVERLNTLCFLVPLDIKDSNVEFHEVCGGFLGDIFFYAHLIPGISCYSQGNKLAMANPPFSCMYVCIDLRYIDVSPVELEGYPAMCRRVGKSMLMPHQELALPRSIWILALHPSEPRSAESHMSSWQPTIQ